MPITVGVTLEPKVCVALARPLRRVLDDARRGGERVPTEVVQAIIDIEAMARDQLRHTSDPDVHPDASGVPVLTSVTVAEEHEVTITEAAALLGCHRQSLWERLNRRSLPGRQDERGRWWLRITDIEAEQQVAEQECTP